MKYQALILLVLMLVHPNCSSQRSDQHRPDGPTLSLGMSGESAMEIIRECGGEDITSRLQLMSRDGGEVPDGLYWSFEQYNSVMAFGVEDGKVSVIEYWSFADFDESKDHRAKSMKRLKSLTFEKQSKTVKTQLL